MSIFISFDALEGDTIALSTLRVVNQIQSVGRLQGVVLNAGLAHEIRTVDADPDLGAHSGLEHRRLGLTLISFLRPTAHPRLHVVTCSHKWMLVHLRLDRRMLFARFFC